MKNISSENSVVLRVCPVCYSEKLSHSKNFGTGWLTPSSYYCKDCGYNGYLYLETNSESLKKLLEEKRVKEVVP